jgi:hypothetical protein
LICFLNYEKEIDMSTETPTDVIQPEAKPAEAADQVDENTVNAAFPSKDKVLVILERLEAEKKAALAKVDTAAAEVRNKFKEEHVENLKSALKKMREDASAARLEAKKTNHEAILKWRRVLQAIEASEASA